jgi:DNA-directed RNA polymerase I, II, and III subunit RPABC2
MSDNEESDYSNAGSDSDSDSEPKITKKSNLLIPKIGLIGGGLKKMTAGATVDDDDSSDDEQEGQTGGIGDDDEPEVDIMSNVSSDDESEVAESEAESEAEEDLEAEEVEEDLEPGASEAVTNKKSAKGKTKKPVQIELPSDDEDEDYDDSYLQKFDSEVTKNYINDFHPECLIQNYDEITKLTTVVRDSNNIIVDPLHRTIPFLTKYEKARILGQRAKQIETGAKPFISVPENVIDGYVIAELELQQKRIPFVIRRPIPGGAFEYWNIRDLEMILF